MRPSDEGIEEFGRIYERLKGLRLTSDAAREMATRLLTIFEIFCRIAPSEKPPTDEGSRSR